MEQQEATYQSKMEQLNLWLPLIIASVRKDLKNEHLKNDIKFFKTHFAGKSLNKLSNEDLSQTYAKVLTQPEAEDLGEYVAHRWLLKNAEIYHFFEDQLVKIAEDFSKIEQIDEQNSNEIMDASIAEFGAANTYIFSILNSVVFHPNALKQLQERAQQETKQNEEEQVKKLEAASWEAKIQSLEEQVARLTDKYEKKLSGMQKKYDADTAVLKKQVSNLQRKINA